MDGKINPNIFLEENKDFFNKYIELLINRLTHATISIEIDEKNVDKPENAIVLYDNMNAFKKLLTKLEKNEDLTLNDIIVIANDVNLHSEYISNGFRKIGDFIQDTDIPIVKGENIEKNMERLLYGYEYTWNKLDIYEKEALFNLNFYLIHPFEDGNRRTSRIILAYHLLKSGYAPALITKDFNEQYTNCAKNKNYSLLANFLREQSIKEAQVINNLFQEYLNNKQDRSVMVNINI